MRRLHLPPTLAFGPPPDSAQFQRAIAAMGEQDWLIFISPQAVYSSQAAIKNAGHNFHLL